MLSTSTLLTIKLILHDEFVHPFNFKKCEYYKILNAKVIIYRKLLFSKPDISHKPPAVSIDYNNVTNVGHAVSE